MKEDTQNETLKPHRSSSYPVDDLPDYDHGDPIYGDDGAGPIYDEYSQVPPRRSAEEKSATKLSKLRGRTH